MARMTDEETILRDWLPKYMDVFCGRVTPVYLEDIAAHFGWSLVRVSAMTDRLYDAFQIEYYQELGWYRTPDTGHVKGGKPEL